MPGRRADPSAVRQSVWILVGVRGERGPRLAASAFSHHIQARLPTSGISDSVLRDLSDSGWAIAQLESDKSASLAALDLNAAGNSLTRGLGHPDFKDAVPVRRGDDFR